MVAKRPVGGLETLDYWPPVEKCRGPSERLYSSVALFCLLPGHEPRCTAIRMVESRLFDPCILLAILANCATMAWQSPLDLPGTQKQHILDVFEWVFLLIFSFEMGVKIVAYGFFGHKGSYLRDPWCQLDFVVVSLAWLPILFPALGNYSALRSVRALRPLRALKRMPGMPVLVQWILEVLPKMFNIVLLCGFVFLVFGIVGMELFKGALHYRCALPGFEGAGVAGASMSIHAQAAFDTGISCHRLTSTGDGHDDGHGDAAAASPVDDDADFGACPSGHACVYFEQNPSHGVNSFDSVGMAFLAFIQAITFDDWATPMYDLMASFSPYAWVYFIAILTIAGFFVVNLFLAVIFLEYGHAVETGQTSPATSQRSPRPSPLSTRRGSFSPPRSPPRSPLPPDDRPLSPTTTATPGSRRSSPERSRALLLSPDQVRSDALAPTAVESPVLFKAGASPRRLLPPSYRRDEAAAVAAAAPADADGDGPSSANRWPCSALLSGCMGATTSAMTSVASSASLGHASTFLVLVNVVIMCMPYEGMTAEYAAQLERAAGFITWLFILEMGVKLLGLGCRGYWADGWNQLDGSIVIMSIVEMLAAALAAGTGIKMSFLRMLRMLRVLRILRLMRSWRGLYRILNTFVRALPQMSNLMILIVLTMFMFALLGMQLFGGLYNESTGYSLAADCPLELDACADGLRPKPRMHFDYCYPAMLTVFVLLTGEWVDAMEPYVAVNGPAVAIFFIFVVLLGKYLLLNLLVAVILTEFQNDDAGPNTPRSPELITTERDGSRRSTRRLSSVPWSHNSAVTFESPGKGSSADHGAMVDGSGGGEPSALSRLSANCRWAVRQPWFDQVVIAAILLSSVCLALDTPRLDPAASLASALSVADKAFTAFFVLEMSVKITGFGFCEGKDAYIRSPWNQLDFVIVCISLLVLLADSLPQLRPLRVLRVMRVLRPLRLVSRNAGMKLIITALFKALPAVSNVFGVILALEVVFVILAMQLFSGTFAACSDPTILTRDDCRPPARWANPTYGSFDNFGDGMRLLYIMSSGDQWERPMARMMGASTPGVAPGRDDFSPMAIYALLWMFVGFIFAINLFVGVVVDNFSRMQKESDGTATMTQGQKQWANTMRALASSMPAKAPRKPAGGLRRWLYEVVTSRHFDGFITGAIVANVGIMALDFWGIEESRWLSPYNRAMDAFAVLYYLECALKIAALGAGHYFGDSWCRFDFFLVCTSLIDQFATELLAAVLPLPPMLLRVLRVIRILRILRLLRHAKELRDLIVTMVLSFPSLLNVSSLLCLILFIYSVLGVHLFTFVAHGDPLADYHGGISAQRNFDNLGHALLVLLQCLTADGWSTIMADAMKDETSGGCDQDAGTCGSLAAIPYFVSFQILGSFIFLNLVVAVILENFATLYFVSPELVSTSDLDVFAEAWTQFDRDATNYVAVARLPELLLKVPRPLGVKGASRVQATRLCLKLRVPQRDGMVAYHELLQELIENNFFRSAASSELNEDEMLSLVPKLQMPKAPPPPKRGPLAKGGGGGGHGDRGDDGDEDEDYDTEAAGGEHAEDGRRSPPAEQLPHAASSQETIAEIYALATMFQDEVKDAFARSLKRARRRIAGESPAAGASGKGSNGRPFAKWSLLSMRVGDEVSQQDKLTAAELVGIGRPVHGRPLGNSSSAKRRRTRALGRTMLHAPAAAVVRAFSPLSPLSPQRGRLGLRGSRGKSNHDGAIVDWERLNGGYEVWPPLDLPDPPDLPLGPPDVIQAAVRREAEQLSAAELVGYGSPARQGAHGRARSPGSERRLGSTNGAALRSPRSPRSRSNGRVHGAASRVDVTTPASGVAPRALEFAPPPPAAVPDEPSTAAELVGYGTPPRGSRSSTPRRGGGSSQAAAYKL